MNNPAQKTILLVEDDVSTMMVETHLLESFGYAVIPAPSGEEAVQIATGNDKIALILMDVDLGSGIDDPEAAKQILLKRNLPVVFLSAHTEKEYVERIKGIAGYGYVVKNSSNVVLQSSIEMAFNLFDAKAAMRESIMLKKILVVDDEPDVVAIIIADLTDKGYRAFGTTNGADAIIVNDKENPGLIILDLRMPEMDGFEILRQIRKTDDKVRVIILTGFGNPDTVKDLADLDVSECLSKPIDHDQLFQVISDVLGR